MKSHRRAAAEFIAWLITDPFTRHILLERIRREYEPQTTGEAATFCQ